ncbi:uncharacterized protein LOC144158401 [Haemaphysalis longicornis]
MASAEPLPDLDFGLLPRRPWLTILENLDAESRLAVADLGRNFRALVYGDQALRSVRCGPNHDASALRRLLSGGRAEHVRKLCLTNCVVARPVDLMNCLASCKRLTELDCVGCHLDVEALFLVVARWLHSLERLAWSLYYDERLRNLFRRTRNGSLEFGARPGVSHIYVEIASGAEPTYRFLAFLLRHCPNLRHLHVHTLRAAHAASVPQCAALAAATRLRTFAYTTDEGVTQMCRNFTGVSERAAGFVDDASVCGNVSLRGPQRRSSCARLGELAPGSNQLAGLRQAVFVVDDTDDCYRRLRQAALDFSWERLRALTLVSWPLGAARRPLGSQQQQAAVHLQCFFATCLNLTELNLNAFHFPENVGFAQMSAAVVHLRALSVTPCGLAGSPSSLSVLAKSCRKLEELDVRANRIGLLTSPCAVCASGEFQVSKDAIGILHWRTALRRFTLSCISGLRSLDFLGASRVTDLRLCSVDSLHDGGYEGLAGLLRHNPRLGSLTVEHKELPLDDLVIWCELVKVKSLRYLCLLSEVKTRLETVESLARYFLPGWAAMHALHVHFRHFNSCPLGRALERVTWIPHGRRDSEGRRPVLTLTDKPCVMCCTSTFIGLAKPRNRSGCRL